MPSSKVKSFLGLFRRTKKPNRTSIWNIFTRKKKYKPSDKPAKKTSQFDPQPAKTRSQIEKDIVDINKIEVIERSSKSAEPVNTNVSMKQVVIDALDVFDSPAVDMKSFSRPTITNIKMITSSFVFTKNNIKSYVESIKSVAPNKLNNICLLNRDDIFNAMFMQKDADNTGSRYISQENKTITTAVKSNLIEFIIQLSSNFCSNSIGATYLEDTFINTFNVKNMTDEYDILFICDQQFTDKNLTFKERIPHIRAFISIQLGECKKYSRAYSIRLLCSRSDIKSAGNGSLLLGCLLYSIHMKYLKTDKYSIDYMNLNMTGEVIHGVNIVDDKTSNPRADIIYGQALGPYIYPAVVLEALSGYVNPGAICTYEKFGFEFDDHLIGADCFRDSRNIPMIFDKGFMYKNNKLVTDDDIMNNHYKKLREIIVNIVAGKDVGYKKDDLCNIKGKYQVLLGHLKSLVHKLEYRNAYPNAGNEITGIDIDLHRIIKNRNNNSTLVVADLVDIVNEIEDYIKKRKDQTPDDYLDDYITEMVDAIGYSSPVKSVSKSPKVHISKPASLSRSASKKRSPIVKLSHKMRSPSFNRSRSSK